MTPRGADTTGSAAALVDRIRTRAGRARLDPDWQRPRCARIFRITAGSCSVATRRSRPPQCGHSRASMAFPPSLAVRSP
jgi:hypothetical protein